MSAVASWSFFPRYGFVLDGAGYDLSSTSSCEMHWVIGFDSCVAWQAMKMRCDLVHDGYFDCCSAVLHSPLRSVPVLSSPYIEGSGLPSQIEDALSVRTSDGNALSHVHGSGDDGCERKDLVG